MSQSAGLASSSHIGRAMLPQQQQPQLQRVRDRATAAATHTDAATASPPPSQQPQQQQEQQQQQQQQQRSRRPRSIHITLRKTRSGSRPVNIQRSQLTGSGNPYGAQGYGVSSPSGPSASPRGGLRDSMDAFRGLDDTTPQRPLHHHHQQQQYQQRQQRGSVPISYTDSAIALATLGTSYQAYTSSTGNGNGNGNGSPSSSFSSNTIAAGIGANVSPPSGSAAGPQLNTFMKPPYSSLQQLLPPSMRDRGGAANNGSGGGNSGGSGVVGGTDGWPAQTPQQQQQQQNYAAAAHRLRSRSQLYMSGAGVYQLADGSSPSVAATTTTTGSAAAPVAQPPISRRRSSSSIGQLDGTTASHSGVLGDFVFPYPGRTTPLPQQQQQQQYQQQSGDAAVLPSGDGVEAAAAAANGLAMTYLDVRSPRLYPPPSTAAGQDGGQPHRHHRARSYTAGGRHARPLTNRSHNGPVVTASMAGAGGAALFAGGTLPAPLTPQQQQQQHSNSVSHAESAATSRNLDRSLSLSSNPATPTPVNTAAAAAAAAVGAAAALTHNNVTTSRSSLRSGTTRETTPVTTAAAPSTGTTPRVMPHVSATPPAQQQQQQPQRQRPALSSTVKSPSSLTSHQQYPLSMTPNATAGGNSAGGGGGGGGGTAPTTPRASAITGRSTRKSGSFATRRSASSDMVNGLDDSVDSVLCGSLDTSGGGLAGQHDDSQHPDIDPNRKGGGSNYNNINNNSSSSTPRRTSGYAAAGATHRYVVDSMTSDSSGGLLQHQHTQQQQQQSTTPTNSDGSRHPRRYSMALTDEEEDSGAATTTNTPAAPAAATAAMSTIQRLRSRRDGGSGGRYDSRPPSSLAASTATAQPPASTRGSEPQSAIERWRAQAEQKRRDEAQQSRRTGRHPQQQQQQQQHHHNHRLSARQWREAFRRLEEHRMKWTMRSFIGAGTSGKVYEGVLEDAAHTPVAVKVLDVRVPMPIGPGGGAAATTSGGMAEDNTMSPAQQEALLVLLREVEMMEKLHHENIVTCLRCQVTPVHDRFMELHTQQQQQQQQQHGGRPPSQARPGDGGSAAEQHAEDGCSGYASPQRCPPAAAPPRIPVQVEIIMELCKRGTLASVVRRSPGGQLPITTARRYLRDVLKGLAYLHRNNFIHRDVKGENVLISASDVAKLADFGCSRRIVMTNSHAAGEALDGTMSSLATTLAPDSRYTTVAEYQWCDATGVAQTMVGTPMFMAPEIIQASGAAPSLPPPPVSPHSVDSTDGCGEEREEGGREQSLHGGGGGGEGEHSPHRAAAAPPPLGYTASADIWSFGCLVLEVFGRSPWPTAGNSVYHLMKQIEQSVDELPPGVPRDTPAELLSLLRCCFHRDPQRRSTARMLLRTPWMTCKDEELTEMPSRKRR